MYQAWLDKFISIDLYRKQHTSGVLLCTSPKPSLYKTPLCRNIILLNLTNIRKTVNSKFTSKCAMKQTAPQVNGCKELRDWTKDKTNNTSCLFLPFTIMQSTHYTNKYRYPKYRVSITDTGDTWGRWCFLSLLAHVLPVSYFPC